MAHVYFFMHVQCSTTCVFVPRHQGMCNDHRSQTVGWTEHGPCGMCPGGRPEEVYKRQR